MEALKPWPLGGYAPGNYTCICCDCEKHFDGDKRAIQCLECAAVAVKRRTPEPDEARPVVKALEWEPVHGEGVETYQATCSIGIYRVFEDEDSAAGAIFAELAIDVRRFCMVDALSIGRVSDFDTAKAAAQADYERRILSALASPTDADAAVVECATEGCGRPSTVYFERGGVGSHYCRDCYMRIQAYAASKAGEDGR